jgi:hypothetical protein
MRSILAIPHSSFDILFQTPQIGFPERPILCHPLIDALQRDRVELIDQMPAFALSAQQTSAHQYPNVLRYRWPADPKASRQRASR